jgi:hypothetical protein
MAAPGREAPLQEVVTKHQSRNEIDDHNPNFHQLTSLLPESRRKNYEYSDWEENILDYQELYFLYL